MSHFRSDVRQRGVDLVALYPQVRSAMLPLLHLAQEHDGYLSDEGITEVAEQRIEARAARYARIAKEQK